MKTNFFSFGITTLFLIFGLGSSSQATLKYVSDKNVRTYLFPKFFFTEEYYFFSTFSSDSIELDNKYYFKTLSFKKNDPNWEKNEPYFREENKMVYYKYLNQPEKLLYNFNLMLGDTLRDNHVGYYKVIKIDTITTDDGLLRKRWLLNNICMNEVKGQTTWIEGLGNVDTYEHRDACIIIDPESTFICASNSGNVVYARSFCQTVNVENTVEYPYKIYPNPASDILTLDGDVDGIQSIQIYDANGRIIDYSKINRTSKEIGIAHLFAGLHWLGIITKEGKTQVIKFVKI